MADLLTILLDRIAELTGGKDGSKRLPARNDCPYCGVAAGQKHRLVLCRGNRRDQLIEIGEAGGLDPAEAAQEADKLLGLFPGLDMD